MAAWFLGDLDPADAEIVPLYGTGDAFDKFGEALGMVNYCLVSFTDNVEQGRAHRVAAGAVIAEAERYYAQRAAGYGRPPPPGYRSDNALATLHPITVPEFVGEGYDWSTGQLESWDGKPGGPRNQRYAYAFSSPPYLLRSSLEQASVWFQEINDRLFGGFESPLTINQWSTDWSTYFDPGHEWWGSFCWTVQRPGSSMVAAIAASTTD